MRGFLKRAARAWDTGERWTLAVLVLGVLSLSLLQILLRWLAGAGVPVPAGFAWVPALADRAVLWIAMLGALAATGARKHIRIDVVSHFLKGVPGRVLETVTGLFAAAVCGWITYAAWVYVHGEWRAWAKQPATPTALPGIPEWAVYAIIPVGFGLMALRFLLHASLTGAGVEEPPGPAAEEAAR
jgi:TRAP-type C4-dicarboxylate transport system permease small subunit